MAIGGEETTDSGAGSILSLNPPLREVEMIKAIRGLAKKIAAGPDGYPVEVLRNLPAALPVILQFFRRILAAGGMPVDLLRLYVIPHDEPRKDPASSGLKKPISLICALSKAMESLVLNRMHIGEHASRKST